MATQEYSKYNIRPFWDKEYKSLSYITEKFNDDAKLAEWAELGYPVVTVGEMCDMRSVQPSWNQLFLNIYQEKGWKDIGTSYYRMNAGAILPTHSDLYKKYVTIFNLQGQEHTIRRAIVFLEDWQSGHYFEVCETPLTNWTAGTVVEWHYNTPHMAANMGIAPRYTLQITGHI
jgi:hypothetical protein